MPLLMGLLAVSGLLGCYTNALAGRPGLAVFAAVCACSASVSCAFDWAKGYVERGGKL